METVASPHSHLNIKCTTASGPASSQQWGASLYSHVAGRAKGLEALWALDQPTGL